MRHPVLVVVIAAVLGSCAAETTPSPSTTAVPPVAGTTSTTEPEDATTIPATTTTAGPEIDVEVTDGLVTGPDRFEYRTGETVSITVVADTEYELHVHGYDLRYDLESETPLTIEFTADVPGIFEVETHPGHLVVFQIEVSG